MSQAEFYQQVLQTISLMPQDRIINIVTAKAQIERVVDAFGEDGLLALSLCGLEGAVKAETEEKLEVASVLS